MRIERLVREEVMFHTAEQYWRTFWQAFSRKISYKIPEGIGRARIIIRVAPVALIMKLISKGESLVSIEELWTKARHKICLRILIWTISSASFYRFFLAE
jgi:hypothetical protein